MRDEGQALLSADRFDTANVAFQYSADVRYAGQSFTLSVPVSMPFEGWELLQEQFAERHIETYGYADKLSEIEIVALRCVAFGLVEKPTIQFRNTTEKKIVGNTDAWFNGAVHSTPIYSRRALPIGSEIEGPAIIEEAGGTTGDSDRMADHGGSNRKSRRTSGSTEIEARRATTTRQGSRQASSNACQQSFSRNTMRRVMQSHGSTKAVARSSQASEPSKALSAADYFAIADRDFPGGGLGGYALPEAVRFLPARARGSRIEDIEGRSYIDFVGGAGAMILGHAHPAVTAAITEQAALGTHFFGTLNQPAFTWPS